jgi:hypothetical protein
MIRLDTAVRSLYGVLGGAVTTNALDVVVSYTDRTRPTAPTFTPRTQVTKLSSTVGQQLCDPPDAVTVREIDTVNVRNTDTVAATVVVFVFDSNSSTSAYQVAVILQTGEVLEYSHARGWLVLTTNGVIKTKPDEGTFTPAITYATPGTLAVTYTKQAGDYVKDGRLVIANFEIVTNVFTLGTAAGDLRISGLPYVAGSGLARYTGNGFWEGISKAAYTELAFVAATGLPYLTCRMSGSGMSASNVAATDTPTGGAVTLCGSVTYLTA